jgi:hypothetical protein
MLLFLPQIILGATLLILLASNLSQRGFRSSWLFTVTGAGLAFASLIFLRLRLPLAQSFSAWWAGEGLVSSISFLLDNASWQIAFVVCGLVLVFFLSEVQRAISAPWLNWAVNLALGVVSLLAVFSGDLLTLAFFWILVDVFTGLALYRFVDKADGRRIALGFLPANVAASFILLAAWILVGYSAQLSNLLAIIAASLRLGIFSVSQANSLDSNQASYLRLLPGASVLVLLARPLALEGFPQSVLLLLLLLPALFVAVNLQQSDERQSLPLFERGMAALAVAAAAIGQPAIALAFGLVLLTGGSLLSLAREARRWRWPVVAVSAVLFSASPFLATDPDSNIPIVFFGFLITYAALIAGWIWFALPAAAQPAATEPWMRVVSILGLLLIPLLFVLLSLGLAPGPSDPTEIVWVPAIALIVLAGIIFLIAQRSLRFSFIPPSLASFASSVASIRWLQAAFDWILDALRWVLRIMSRLLEGQAGVLWAMLLIVLLLSLASQLALGV